MFCFYLFFLSVPVAALSIEYKPCQDFFYYEAYGADNLGVEGALGYQTHLFLTPDIGLSAAVTGAVLGIRGGYGTASVGVSYRIPVFFGDFQTSFLFGGGGMKAIPTTGGGLVINFQAGFNIPLAEELYLGVRAGRFPYAQGYSNMYVDFGICHSFLLPWIVDK